jgi:hypothetical protein
MDYSNAVNKANITNKQMTKDNIIIHDTSETFDAEHRCSVKNDTEFCVDHKFVPTKINDYKKKIEIEKQKKTSEQNRQI